MKKCTNYSASLDSTIGEQAGWLLPPPELAHWQFGASWLGKMARSWDGLVLMLLLAAFVGLQALLPLGTAVKLGADEDYELSKATLCNHGYKLYTDIWNDQPPLVTSIISNLLKLTSNSVLAPRLLSVGSSLVLLAATFILVRAISGQLAAVIATVMLIASPGFLELSCSVMQEIPALAPAVAAMCLLDLGPRSRWWVTEMVAGAIFGFALQMKLIGVIYLPVAGAILWLRSRQRQDLTSASRIRVLVKSGTVFGACMVACFVVLNCLTGNSLLLQLQLSWAAHFANAASFEYGSPAQYSFDWSLLLKNWDTSLPAIFGLWVLVKAVRRNPVVILPISWLAVTLGVFTVHKPWWPYYYIHNALPLCWCAGVGLAALWQATKRGASSIKYPASRILLGSIFGVSILCAAGWLCSRLYLEATAIRRVPKLDSSLVLHELERFKPYAKFLFSDQPIYTFHASIPMPPHLAVLSLKRLWTGDMTNAKLVAELEEVKPGLILLGKLSTEVPYQDLLNREYRLVYQDGADRLYAHVTIAKKPEL